MQSMNKSMLQITALEDLAYKNTALHRLHPMVKLIIALCYVMVVVSFLPEDVSGLIPFIILPVFCMIIGEIPFTLLAVRSCLALPFAILAGVSNIFLSRDVVLNIAGIGITEGMISFTSLVLKTLLTVSVVLLLISSTTMNDLIYAMLGLHIPSLIVIQIMMTYRYLKILMEEARVMKYAYLLRAPKEKGIKFQDIGSFLGHLILRSMDRSERIYQAMKCRGFEGSITFSDKRKLSFSNLVTLVAVGLILITLRFINISTLLGSWIS